MTSSATIAGSLSAGERISLRPGELPPGAEHEELVVARGERSGLLIAVAIHSTVLGPSLGGVRMWHYPDPAGGIDDVLRLAGAMTLKAAAAGLGLGGGKGVICSANAEPPSGAARRAALHDFGDLVASLHGRYLTAEDVGSAVPDMEVIAERTEHVTGLPASRGGSGDPSVMTAVGVEAAMRATAASALGSRELAGRHVVIIGAGHVGSLLGRSLTDAGARVTFSDIDEDRRQVAQRIGAGWLDADEAPAAECDLLAPCAVGGAINAESIAALRCRAICGAANNQLADDALVADLAARGIAYAPDFVANAGGIINIFGELDGYGPDEARRRSEAIEGTMASVFEAAARERVTTLAAARALAERRLRAERP